MSAGNDHIDVAILDANTPVYTSAWYYASCCQSGRRRVCDGLVDWAKVLHHRICCKAACTFSTRQSTSASTSFRDIVDGIGPRRLTDRIRKMSMQRIVWRGSSALNVLPCRYGAARRRCLSSSAFRGQGVFKTDDSGLHSFHERKILP